MTSKDAPAPAPGSEGSALGSVFDRTLRELRGVPDVTPTKATTVRHWTPVLEQPQTFIVQTFRHRERGDTVSVEYVGPDGLIRLCLPPKVTDLIARHRAALTKRVRSKIGKQTAAERKAAGWRPDFTPKKGKKAKAE